MQSVTAAGDDVLLKETGDLLSSLVSYALWFALRIVAHAKCNMFYMFVHI